MKRKQDSIYIIAEIGGNFTTLSEAKNLIDEAVRCKVDAVKIQTYQAETLCCTKAMFDMEAVGVSSQYDYFTKYELSEKLHREIFAYAKEKNIDIFSTPSHYSDAVMLERLGVDVYKIGADDAVNIPLLKKIALLGKPIILSTGMCTLKEVISSVYAILSTGNDQIMLMHTVSAYPTYPEAVNLLAIQTLQREFPHIPVGYSDHTKGILACLFAASMGAQMIEKHFIVKKSEEYPDSILSADSAEMEELVASIRLFETMRGTGIKMPDKSELINREKNRKSIVANRFINKGESLTLDNIDVKRPGSGISPEFLEQILGKTASRTLEKDAILGWGDFI